MGSVAVEVLDEDVSAVRLEGNAIYTVHMSAPLHTEVEVIIACIPSPLLITEFWITIFFDRYVSQPSVFLASFSLLLYPEISIPSKSTSDEFATSWYHCGE